MDRVKKNRRNDIPKLPQFWEQLRVASYKSQVARKSSELRRGWTPDQNPGVGGVTKLPLRTRVPVSLWFRSWLSPTPLLGRVSLVLIYRGLELLALSEQWSKVVREFFKELVELRVQDAARTRMPQNWGRVKDLISEAGLTLSDGENPRPSELGAGHPPKSSVITSKAAKGRCRNPSVLPYHHLLRQR
jgi:hypothetical protein